MRTAQRLRPLLFLLCTFPVACVGQTSVRSVSDGPTVVAPTTAAALCAVPWRKLPVEKFEQLTSDAGFAPIARRVLATTEEKCWSQSLLVLGARGVPADLAVLLERASRVLDPTKNERRPIHSEAAIRAVALFVRHASTEESQNKARAFLIDASAIDWWTQRTPFLTPRMARRHAGLRSNLTIVNLVYSRDKKLADWLQSQINGTREQRQARYGRDSIKMLRRTHGRLIRAIEAGR